MCSPERDKGRSHFPKGESHAVIPSLLSSRDVGTRAHALWHAFEAAWSGLLTVVGIQHLISMARAGPTSELFQDLQHFVFSKILDPGRNLQRQLGCHFSLTKRQVYSSLLFRTFNRRCKWHGRLVCFPP